MSKSDVVNEVSKFMTAALNAAPGEVRDVLRSEAPKVVKALAEMAKADKGTTVRDRRWAFDTFFGLIRGTVMRDTALQNAIAHRHEAEAAKILANVKKITATTESRKIARRHRADMAADMRTLAAARKVPSAA